jgi:hypothetical protein
MKTGEELSDKIDAIITEALHEEPGHSIPAFLAEKIMKKIRKQMILQELFNEFFLKLSLVSGVLVAFFIILLITGIEYSHSLLSGITSHWQMISIVIFSIAFTFMADQIFLKYFLRKSGT